MTRRITDERRISAYERVLENIGLAIVSGELPPGHGDTVEGFEARTGASRSIVREATRVLVSLGLLRAGPRVGLRVLPETSWNVLDSHVIAWRLVGTNRSEQLDELRDLRLAVEPEAARLAAERRSAQEVEALMAAAEELRAASQAGGSLAFLEADQRLHGLVLQASGNRMFVRLRSVIDTALRDRALRERAERPAEEHDVELHVELARAIARSDREGAAALLREIILRTRE